MFEGSGTHGLREISEREEGERGDEEKNFDKKIEKIFLNTNWN